MTEFYLAIGIRLYCRISQPYVVLQQQQWLMFTTSIFSSVQFTEILFSDLHMARSPPDNVPCPKVS